MGISAKENKKFDLDNYMMTVEEYKKLRGEAWSLFYYVSLLTLTLVSLLSAEHVKDKVSVFTIKMRVEGQCKPADEQSEATTLVLINLAHPIEALVSPL